MFVRRNARDGGLKHEVFEFLHLGADAVENFYDVLQDFGRTAAEFRRQLVFYSFDGLVRNADAGLAQAVELGLNTPAHLVYCFRHVVRQILLEV